WPLICRSRRGWSALLGALRAESWCLNFCLGIAPPSSSCLPPPLLRDIYRGFRTPAASSQQAAAGNNIGLCTAGVRRESVNAAAGNRGFAAGCQARAEASGRDSATDPADSQLRPKLALSAELVCARASMPAQLLPALQDWPQAARQQQQPWLRAEHWARLLRLNLEMTVASEAANHRLEEDRFGQPSCPICSPACWLRLRQGKKKRGWRRLRHRMMMGSESSGTESEEEGRGRRQRIGPRGVWSLSLAACLAPLPLPPGPMLLQSLQSGRVSGLAGLLCELDAPQHAAALELPGADSQQPRPSRQLSRWLLACLAALFKAAGGSRASAWGPAGQHRLAAVDRRLAAAGRRRPERDCWSCLAAYAPGLLGGRGPAEAPRVRSPVRPRLPARPMAPSGWLRCARFSACWTALATSSSTVLAADCVPALAELAEDDSEEVEAAGPAAAGPTSSRRAGEPLELLPSCGAAVERKRKFNRAASSGQQKPAQLRVFVGGDSRQHCANWRSRRIFQKSHRQASSPCHPHPSLLYAILRTVLTRAIVNSNRPRRRRPSRTARS
uniref:RING-type domain-containing protein n=1 Tax=Macrostomum lignano TaxID=282301 RepID=A0A1I8FJ54_9PLAT